MHKSWLNTVGFSGLPNPAGAPIIARDERFPGREAGSQAVRLGWPLVPNPRRLSGWPVRKLCHYESPL